MKNFKPWIKSFIKSRPNAKALAKIVKIVKREVTRNDGSIVKITTDGDVSIKTVFTPAALAALGEDSQSDPDTWNSAVLILQQYSLHLEGIQTLSPEYVLMVDGFKLWDLQPGFEGRFIYDAVPCMSCSDIKKISLKEQANLRELANRPSCSQMGDPSFDMSSVPLSQLLHELGQASSRSQSQPPGNQPCTSVSTEPEVSAGNQEAADNQIWTGSVVSSISDHLLERLFSPFTVEEFIIPQEQQQILDQIKESDSSCHEDEERSESEATSTGSLLNIDCPTLADDWQGAQSHYRHPASGSKDSGKCAVVGESHSNTQTTQQSQDSIPQWQNQLESVYFSDDSDDCSQSLATGISENVTPPRNISSPPSLQAMDGAPTSDNTRKLSSFIKLGHHITSDKMSSAESILTSVKVVKEITTSEGIPPSGKVSGLDRIPASDEVLTSKGISTSEKIPTMERIPTSGEIPTLTGIHTSRGMPSLERILSVGEIPSSKEIPRTGKMPTIGEMPPSGKIPTSKCGSPMDVMNTLANFSENTDMSCCLGDIGSPRAQSTQIEPIHMDHGQLLSFSEDKLDLTSSTEETKSSSNSGNHSVCMSKCKHGSITASAHTHIEQGKLLVHLVEQKINERKGFSENNARETSEAYKTKEVNNASSENVASMIVVEKGLSECEHIHIRKCDGLQKNPEEDGIEVSIAIATETTLSAKSNTHDAVSSCKLQGCSQENDAYTNNSTASCDNIKDYILDTPTTDTSRKRIDNSSVSSGSDRGIISPSPEAVGSQSMLKNGGNRTLNDTTKMASKLFASNINEFVRNSKSMSEQNLTMNNSSGQSSSQISDSSSLSKIYSSCESLQSVLREKDAIVNYYAGLSQSGQSSIEVLDNQGNSEHDSPQKDDTRVEPCKHCSNDVTCKHCGMRTVPHIGCLNSEEISQINHSHDSDIFSDETNYPQSSSTSSYCSQKMDSLLLRSSELNMTDLEAADAYYVKEIEKAQDKEHLKAQNKRHLAQRVSDRTDMLMRCCEKFDDSSEIKGPRGVESSEDGVTETNYVQGLDCFVFQKTARNTVQSEIVLKESEGNEASNDARNKANNEAKNRQDIGRLDKEDKCSKRLQKNVQGEREQDRPGLKLGHINVKKRCVVSKPQKEENINRYPYCYTNRSGTSENKVCSNYEEVFESWINRKRRNQRMEQKSKSTSNNVLKEGDTALGDINDTNRQHFMAEKVVDSGERVLPESLSKLGTADTACTQSSASVENVYDAVSTKMALILDKTEAGREREIPGRFKSCPSLNENTLKYSVFHVGATLPHPTMPVQGVSISTKQDCATAISTAIGEVTVTQTKHTEAEQNKKTISDSSLNGSEAVVQYAADDPFPCTQPFDVCLAQSTQVFTPNLAQTLAEDLHDDLYFNVEHLTDVDENGPSLNAEYAKDVDKNKIEQNKRRWKFTRVVDQNNASIKGKLKRGIKDCDVCKEGVSKGETLQNTKKTEKGSCTTCDLCLTGKASTTKPRPCSGNIVQYLGKLSPMSEFNKSSSVSAKVSEINKPNQNSAKVSKANLSSAEIADVSKSSSSSALVSEVIQPSPSLSNISKVNKSSENTLKISDVDKPTLKSPKMSEANKSNASSANVSDVNKYLTRSGNVSDVNKSVTKTGRVSDENKSITRSDKVFVVNKSLTSSDNVSDGSKLITRSDNVSDVNKLITRSDKVSDVNKSITRSEKVSDVNKSLTRSGKVSDGSKLITRSDKVAEVNKSVTRSDKVTEVNKSITRSDKVSDVNKSVIRSGKVSDVNKSVARSDKVSDVNKSITKSGKVSDVSMLITRSGKVSDVNKSTFSPAKVLKANKASPSAHKVLELNKPSLSSATISEVNKSSPSSDKISDVNKFCLSLALASVANKYKRQHIDSCENRFTLVRDKQNRLLKPKSLNETTSGTIASKVKKMNAYFPSTEKTTTAERLNVFKSNNLSDKQGPLQKDNIRNSSISKSPAKYKRLSRKRTLEALVYGGSDSEDDMSIYQPPRKQTIKDCSRKSSLSAKVTEFGNVGMQETRQGFNESITYAYRKEGTEKPTARSNPMPATEAGASTRDITQSESQEAIVLSSESTDSSEPTEVESLAALEWRRFMTLLKVDESTVAGKKLASLKKTILNS